MTIHADIDDQLKQLEKHLDEQMILQAREDDFDMCDGPEMALLGSCKGLHGALQWLEPRVSKPWREANRKARRSRKRHRALARTAIASGTAAIVLAVVQPPIKLTSHQWTNVALGLEAVAVITAFVAVAVGLISKYHREWLGQRHLAELLRMLKFRALAEACRLDLSQWQKWLEGQLNELNGAADFERVEKWAKQGEYEPPQRPLTPGALDLNSARALTTYYRIKRIRFQSGFFKSRSLQYAKQTRRWRHLSLQLFLVSVFCVLVHFLAEFRENRLRSVNPHEADVWGNIAIWFVAAAAIIPLVGIGVRAWFAAFELSRITTLFTAINEAMTLAAANLEVDCGDPAATLRHLETSEQSLEREHREWLRLLSHAEWFL